MLFGCPPPLEVLPLGTICICPVYLDLHYLYLFVIFAFLLFKKKFDIIETSISCSPKFNLPYIVFFLMAYPCPLSEHACKIVYCYHFTNPFVCATVL